MIRHQTTVSRRPQNLTFITEQETMSHPTPHHENADVPSLKPRPRRPFELSSPPPSEPSTPTGDEKPPYLQASTPQMDDTSTPARTRSILNLTSSTLFGIYQPTGYATEREEPSTPWGTGAETPADSRHTSFDIQRANIPDLVEEPVGAKKRRRSTAQQLHAYRRPRRGLKGYWLPLAGRATSLFIAGVLYGLLVTHLHDRQGIAPARVHIDRSSWAYLAMWGAAGVALGEALPWLDTLWEEDDEDAIEEDQDRKALRGLGSWNDVVRSVGVFVGIAYAIRKLPWQSTLQLSLTLALANPAVWYIIDRSPPGFLLSSLVSLAGTAFTLGIFPALVPSPSPEQWRVHGTNGTTATPQNDELVLGVFSQESVGVATWIASVLFVSSVCFGNIGRRLAAEKS